MPPHTPKRVRTGCLKCRVRRRKCDEGKPRCQRCITGGFECRYGTRVSFLDKNVITARGGRSSRNPSPTYRTVQFVTESIGQSSNSEAERQASTPSPSVVHTTSESPTVDLGSTLTTQESTTAGAAPGSTTAAPFEQSTLAEPEHTSPHYDDDWPAGFSPADGYEAALDALLSLGADRSGSPTEQRGTPRATATLGGHRTQGGVGHVDCYTSSSNHGNDIPLAIGLESVIHELGLSESRVLGLLRYYRYEVAPWLDICDLGQTFGNLVSCLTAVNTSVLISVVSFASSLSGETFQGDEGNTVDPTPPSCSGPTSQLSQLDFSTRLLCRVLSQTKWILGNELGRSLHGVDEFAETFSPPPLSFATHPVDVATYYLILRFDFGCSLANGQPLKLPLWPLDDFPFNVQGSEIAAQVFRSASEVLVLCARATNLVFGGHDAQGRGRVEQWTSLLDCACVWYANRFQTFKPMVDVDGKGDDFPLVLFTSGAALMANQLYHTTMLLLLQNKPRTFKARGSRVSSTMSALWHARMICGVALGNDARECWDPSLVASFVLAARGMTHWDQQRRLLGKLDEVGRLTGWKVGGYRKMMMEEWGM